MAPRRAAVHGGAWSAHELERLRESFPRTPLVRLAALLRRSEASVRRRALQLFTRPPRRGAWTPAEDQQLRLAYGIHDLPVLVVILARRERDLRTRIQRLRRNRQIGPWKPAEIALLKEIYGTRADADLEICLSRPMRQIAAQAARLCLSKDKRFVANTPSAVRMPRWTAAEIARLTAFYPDHDNLTIAQKLGRSVVSIANKAKQLGLRKSAARLEDMGRRNVAVRYDDLRNGETVAPLPQH